MCTVSKVAEEPLRGRLWSVWLWQKRISDVVVNRGEYASQQSQFYLKLFPFFTYFAKYLQQQLFHSNSLKV